MRGFCFACRAMVLCIMAPSRFVPLARAHDARIPPIAAGDDHDAFRLQSARLVSRAFSQSCLLTLGALFAGYVLGSSLKRVTGPAGPPIATLLQACSAAVVLVATLAACGWEIQTWGGESLVEKVNQWLIRSLFVVGTFFFSLFLGWAQ